MPQESTAPVANRLAATGVVRINYDFTPDLNGVPTYDYNKYSNPFKTSDYRTAELKSSELAYIRRDTADFTELRMQLNGEDGQSDYFDIQRQLVMDKGEDRYYHLFGKKKREYQALVSGYFKKKKIQENRDYFCLDQAANKLANEESGQFAGRQWRVQELAQEQAKTEKIRKQKQDLKLVGYNLQLNASYIANKVVSMYKTLDGREKKKTENNDDIL